MKKTILYITALLALVSCSGTGQGTDPDGYTAPYTLAADKLEVEASGKDYVTFTLTDANGRNILEDRRALQNVRIYSAEGQIVDRDSDRICFITNGTHNFSARFNGEESVNTVQIVAQNRLSYEKFHKNVAIYKCTGTWCPACPGMTTALKNINEDTENHSVEMCWHGVQSESTVDPWAIPEANYTDCGNALLSYFASLTNKSLGFPTVILDLSTVVTDKSSSAIQQAIWKLRAEYPATSGIKLESVYDSAKGEINLNAELTSSTGGKYDMGFAVLLHDQYWESGQEPDKMYSHIVRATTTNFAMYKELKDVAKDSSLGFGHTFKTGGEIDAENMTVVAWSLVKTDDGARIDNIVEVKLGESVDYIYNE